MTCTRVSPAPPHAPAVRTQVALHPLLGQLVSGIIIVNINAHWLTGGLKKSWSMYIRVGALALIFLRSGLELDWEVRVCCVLLKRWPNFEP